MKKLKNPYVEIKTGEKDFERREITLGISDGLNVEVKDGLSEEDEIKIWNRLKDL